MGTLAFIAMLIAASILVIDSIASEEALLTEFGETGSRQRMLSERVVHLTLEYAVMEDQETRRLLVGFIDEALKQFDQTHKLLIRGQLENGHHIAFSESIDDIFFGAPIYLDEKARIFIYNTREVLSRDWSEELISNYYLMQLRLATIEELNSSLEMLAEQFSENADNRITRLRIIVAMLLGGIIFVLFWVGIFIFVPLFKRIAQQEAKLHRLAYLDPLTNIQNRRSFLDNAEMEYERSKRYGRPYAALYLDIDYFKDINDSHGHYAGDVVIKKLTEICQENIRDTDFLGRIGGDEFAIILQECGLQKAALTAEKLRECVANFRFPDSPGPVEFSVSIGAAAVIDTDRSAYDTLKRADQNLYKSKRSGRNLVVAA